MSEIVFNVTMCIKYIYISVCYGQSKLLDNANIARALWYCPIVMGNFSKIVYCSGFIELPNVGWEI